MREQGVALEHHGGAAGDRRQADHALAVDPHVAAGGRLVPGDHAQDRGLAAAGRAEQAAIGAGRDGQARRRRPRPFGRTAWSGRPDRSGPPAPCPPARPADALCAFAPSARPASRQALRPPALDRGDRAEGRRDDRRNEMAVVTVPSANSAGEVTVRGHGADLERQRVLGADASAPSARNSS